MPRPFSPTELETLTLKRGRKRAFKLAGEIPRTPLEFCGRYAQFPLSAAWVAVIMLLYAIAGVAADVVRTICGFDPPSRPRTYRSLLVLAGRRSGKSSVAVLIGLFEAIVRGVDHMKHLAVGQRGYVLILARTQRQSLETFRYGRAIVENNPELLALVDGEILESQTGGEIRFLNGVVWAVFPASKSSVRGFTVIFSLIEEAAFLGGTDDESANQDREIIAAVTYAMLAPTGAPIRRLVVHRKNDLHLRRGRKYTSTDRTSTRPPRPPACVLKFVGSVTSRRSRRVAPPPRR